MNQVESAMPQYAQPVKLQLQGDGMKRFLFVASAVAFGALVATPAFATDNSSTVHVISSPDDGTPPWARDTFDRKTTIAENESGTGYIVTIKDTGTFETPAGIKGTLTGSGRFAVTGGQLKPKADWPTGDIDRSSVAVKDSFTGNWWSEFFTGDDAKSSGIVGWKWTYKTDCEKRTESEAGVQGAYPSKVCPKPSQSSSSASPSPSTSTGGAGTHSNSPSVGAPGTNRGGLPVTGPGVGTAVVVGLGVLLGGAALIWSTRRRRARFEA